MPEDDLEADVSASKRPGRKPKATSPAETLAKGIELIYAALEGLEGSDAGKARTRLIQLRDHAQAAMKG